VSGHRAQIEPWPKLPEKVALALALVDSEEPGSVHYPRPWDLSRLENPLADHVWRWLEQVVQWLNVHCAWKPEDVIPPCWSQHPHLALELAVLAFDRQHAIRSQIPAELHQWHLDLAAFHVRTRDAIGETSLKDCQRRNHSERPSNYELALYAQASMTTSQGDDATGSPA
jgi:hypothetical protein